MSAPVQRPRLHLMTASRLRSINTCMRQHEFRYELGITPVVDAAALRFGTVMHLGLESWWRAFAEGVAETALDRALVAVTESIERSAERGAPTMDAFETARVMAMLAGYDARWHSFAATCEVIGVEVPFLLPMLHPQTGEPARGWRIAGKMDGVLRLADGRVAVLEHKGSSDDVTIGSDYRRKLLLDAQVSHYFDGVTSLGLTAEVCIYDVLVKPKTRPAEATPPEKRRYTQPSDKACPECNRKRNATPPPHTDTAGRTCANGRIVTDPGGALYAGMREFAETPEEYGARVIADVMGDLDGHFHHVEVSRLPHEQVNHREDVWFAAKEVMHARHNGVHRRNTHACFKFGRCPYLDVCEGTARVDDPARFKRVSDPHVELTDAQPQTATTGEDR